ncbi:UNVERIFIED_ORG: hypothetical protein CLV66_101123 [Actinomadura viridilutea]
MQPDPYRSWRLGIFAVVCGVAALYVAFLLLSFVLSLVT